MQKLKEIWRELAASYTDNQSLIDELWTEIETHYSAPRRHYHNLDHVAYAMEKALAHRDGIEDVATLQFSVFYHDLVYDVLRDDNEEKSAEKAEEYLASLGVPAEKIAYCREQILATKTHGNNSDHDTNYLLDVDLAILGESIPIYRDYAEKIRREYSMYPIKVYKKGRKDVLSRLLDRDRLFQTYEFYTRYEARARENLRREWEELSN